MNGLIGGDLIAASAAIMLGSDAQLMQKNVTITENGTYTYDPADDNADGYSGVTVGVNVDDGSAEIARLRQQLQECEGKCEEIREYLYYVINDKPYDPEDPDPPLIGDTVPEIEGAIDDVLEKGYDEGYDDAGGDPSTKPIRIKPVHRQGSDGNYYTYSVEMINGHYLARGNECPYLSAAYQNIFLRPLDTLESGATYFNLLLKITINGQVYYANFNYPNDGDNRNYVDNYWLENGELCVRYYFAPRNPGFTTAHFPILI